jgi:hypothetical protein
MPSGRLCENSVHGSTWLTTNGRENTEIKYLSVRPERCRRAPKVFSHSLAQARNPYLLRRSLVSRHSTTRGEPRTARASDARITVQPEAAITRSRSGSGGADMAQPHCPRLEGLVPWSRETDVQMLMKSSISLRFVQNSNPPPTRSSLAHIIANLIQTPGVALHR